MYFLYIKKKVQVVQSISLFTCTLEFYIHHIQHLIKVPDRLLKCYKRTYGPSQIQKLKRHTMINTHRCVQQLSTPKHTCSCFLTLSFLQPSFHRVRHLLLQPPSSQWLPSPSYTKCCRCFLKGRPASRHRYSPPSPGLSRV